MGTSSLRGTPDGTAITLAIAATPKKISGGLLYKLIRFSHRHSTDIALLVDGLSKSLDAVKKPSGELQTQGRGADPAAGDSMHPTFKQVSPHQHKHEMFRRLELVAQENRTSTMREPVNVTEPPLPGVLRSSLEQKPVSAIQNPWSWRPASD
ncbi:hypothetical protein [Mycolicibacterium frederiksbergense]|uniref:Uncharacterized protein n=1 Tax=Mycolicibacterium frederiksbergense TaxID=117567 RepID=A0A6H0S034_9MYCO|nr:hypothetical protein [Mycolicibacterium frederiksbergense]QIV79839.1 hypothetical protein EXE63_02100 [Mycolicibacterium frederiksbergense]